MVAETIVPAQTGVLFGRVVTFPEGFTVMVKYMTAPVQLLYVPFTAMLATLTVFVVFVAVKAGMLPVPDAGRPMAGLLFVHENVVPAMELVKLRGKVRSPLQ